MEHVSNEDILIPQLNRVGLGGGIPKHHMRVHTNMQQKPEQIWTMVQIHWIRTIESKNVLKCSMYILLNAMQHSDKHIHYVGPTFHSFSLDEMTQQSSLFSCVELYTCSHLLIYNMENEIRRNNM